MNAPMDIRYEMFMTAIQKETQKGAEIFKLKRKLLTDNGDVNWPAVGIMIADELIDEYETNGRIYYIKGDGTHRPFCTDIGYVVFVVNPWARFCSLKMLEEKPVVPKKYKDVEVYALFQDDMDQGMEEEEKLYEIVKTEVEKMKKIK
jgi:hypothetical protein